MTFIKTFIKRKHIEKSSFDSLLEKLYKGETIQIYSSFSSVERIYLKDGRIRAEVRLDLEDTVSLLKEKSYFIAKESPAYQKYILKTSYSFWHSLLLSILRFFKQKPLQNTGVSENE